ncbi:PerC family transcriptional regulator [Klebsiella aerogenes]|uniref:PerC family transcriptional regulator n=1 Tax=Klebsiella aerogenes TaxID=548 RepID=UPI0009409B10|nr:PerC family transcriptional regulator [Klebsiella aerogenes]
MEKETLTPVADKLAEGLESAGLYRRAATRWLEVFFECLNDSERSWVSRRRQHCLSQMQTRKQDDTYQDICSLQMSQNMIFLPLHTVLTSSVCSVSIRT